MLFPLLISAFGIVICIITSFVATNLTKVDQVEKIEATLKNQLLISTILMTPAIFGAGYLTLPEYFLYDTTKNTFDFLILDKKLRLQRVFNKNKKMFKIMNLSLKKYKQICIILVLIINFCSISYTNFYFI